MKRRNSAPKPACGSIRADEVLTLAEFVRRLGIGQKTWRSMKAAGLQSALIGKQRYILGRHVLAFFERLTEQQAEYSKSHITTTPIEKILDFGAAKVESFRIGGFSTLETIENAANHELLKVKGIGQVTVQRIRERIAEYRRDGY